MSTEIERILEKIRQVKPEMEKDYFVIEIGVFGSYARGDQTESSDIDILVDFRRGMTLFKLVDFKDYLESLFEKNVDIVMKRALKPKLAKYILDEVIYA